MDGQQGHMMLSAAAPEAAKDAAPLVVPRDPARHRQGAAVDRRAEIRRWVIAIALTILCYAVIVVSFLLSYLSWPDPPASPPKAITVTMVVEPPPPPPAKAPPRPPEEKPAYRESGKDSVTTAPPPAEARAPEVKAPDAAPPPQPVAPTAPQAIPRKPRQAPAHSPTEKQAAVAQAPHPALPQTVLMRPGEKDQRGDPYLNTLMGLIERHRFYPELARPSGLEGAPVYVMSLDDSGKLIRLGLLKSSGALVIDQAGARMIQEASPFPPPPPQYLHGPSLSIEVTLPIYQPPG